MGGGYARSPCIPPSWELILQVGLGKQCCAACVHISFGCVSIQKNHSGKMKPTFDEHGFTAGRNHQIECVWDFTFFQKNQSWFDTPIFAHLWLLWGILYTDHPKKCHQWFCWTWVQGKLLPIGSMYGIFTIIIYLHLLYKSTKCR